MAEWKLFPDGTIPECTTAAWYLSRERAPHLEQPGHRDRLLKTAEIVLEACHGGSVRSVVDLGCGDGGLLSLLRKENPDIPAWGYDLSPDAIRAANNARNVVAFLGDIISDAIDWGDLAVATEIFEHLVDPHAFAREIAKNSPLLVASSPAHETDRNHYEFHTWAWDKDGYCALVEQAGYTVRWHGVVAGAQILAAQK